MKVIFSQKNKIKTSYLLLIYLVAIIPYSYSLKKVMEAIIIKKLEHTEIIKSLSLLVTVSMITSIILMFAGFFMTSIVLNLLLKFFKAGLSYKQVLRIYSISQIPSAFKLILITIANFVSNNPKTFLFFDLKGYLSIFDISYILGVYLIFLGIKYETKLPLYQNISVVFSMVVFQVIRTIT